MKIKVMGIDIIIDIAFIISVILFIMIDNVRNFLALYFLTYICIIFHEASHVLVFSIFGKHLKSINFTIGGMFAEFEYTIDEALSFKKRNIRVESLKKIAIFSAGPISSILLAFFLYKIQVIYELNLVICLINLLPIFPLDGYNILKNFIKILLSIKKDAKNLKEATKKIANIISLLFLFVIIGVIGYTCIKTGDFFATIFCLYLLTLNIQNAKET